MTATNGVGWIVEEFFSDVGWQHSKSFPVVYDTIEEAKKIMDKRLKGAREFRVYEKLV